MATSHHDLPRLSISGSMQAPMPVGVDNRHPLFSPALPSGTRPGFLPQFPPPLQTPVPPFFNAQLPGASGRVPPFVHQVRPSLSHVNAVGLHPANGLPMTPLGQTQFPQMTMVNGFPFSPQFQPRNRRSASVTLGGPPKAVLGGPARKLSPLPQKRVSTSPTPAQVPVAKKITVNLPKETIPGEDGQSSTRPSWARVPQKSPPDLTVSDLKLLELTSADPYPPESWTRVIPPSVDVFLPGKSAWDALRQRLIEEKLEKLGVEKGSGSSVPHIYAPHARAASISSPADPALLFFKLNKLQKSQTNSTSNSLSASPQPPTLSPSPNSLLPKVPIKHVHSMSLAPPLQPPYFNPSGAFNPFGPNAVLGSDQILDGDNIHAPQGRVPVTIQSLSAPDAGLRSRPSSRDSKPDFNRGFGLDIPEEDEEAEVNEQPARESPDRANSGEDGEDIVEDQQDDATTIAQSRLHSRHVSRLSAALSLRSVGGRPKSPSSEDEYEANLSLQVQVGDLSPEDEVGDEWTGSEDFRQLSEISEDESIGEFSNPSDEEHARQERLRRRNMRLALAESEIPRRIPNFPPPPSSDIIDAHSRSIETITNPSEEGLDHPEIYLGDESARPTLDVSTFEQSSQPLPLEGHSKTTPGSHNPSFEHNPRVSSGSAIHADNSNSFGSSAMPRRDSLNPLAKPFIFGGAQMSGSWVTPIPESAPSSHSRNVSIGKPLNAAAVEFTPGGFNFQPPSGVPQLTFAATASGQATVATEQGREKRRRHRSGSQDSVEQMASFRFPLPDEESSPSPRHRSQASLEPPAPHFDLPGSAAHSRVSSQQLSPTAVANEQADIIEETPMKSSTELPKSRPKRQPIPLDFTHTISRNTVPAGLFKALGEERTRRSVRSRMSSRDVIEHMHGPSLDDGEVPPIARRSNLRTYSDATDLCSTRRSQSPGRSGFGSGPSTGISIPAVDMTRSIDMQEFEERLELVLDSKFEAIRNELFHKDLLEALVAEAFSLVASQIQDSTAQRLKENQEENGFDLTLLKDVVEQSLAKNRTIFQSQLDAIVDRLSASDVSASNPPQSMLQASDAVLDSLSQISVQLENVRPSSKIDQNVLLRDLMDGIAPALDLLRPDPVDYEYVTSRLTQAVKPEIAQLIDLASDKRETASLIVERLVPLLPNPSAAQEMIRDVIGQLTTEIRRAIASIDAFEIKEQVADLVVERLDSRLAVRDRAFNVEAVAGKVAEEISHLLQPLNQVPDALSNLKNSQQLLAAKQEARSSSQANLVSELSQLPAKFAEVTTTLSAIEELCKRPQSSSNDEAIVQIKSSLEKLVAKHQSSSQHFDSDLQSLGRDCLEQLKTLPPIISYTTTAIEALQAESVSTRDTLNSELAELRKTNTELQIELTKVRSAHEQLKLENQFANEKVRASETERERLCSQIRELQTSVDAKIADFADLERKNRDLDKALEQGLDRLKAADVAAQTSQEQIQELEKTNQDLVAEKHILKSKAEKLELQLTFAQRDNDSSTQALATLRKQYDHLASQQSHWDALHRASQEIETITSLFQHTNSEEMKELKRIRDSSQAFENEHAALKKRFKDQESKIANGERALATAKQSLATANQRSAEWERRAKESEGKYELVHTQFEQLEQTHSQLEADHNLAASRLEDKEAEERLHLDRENRLLEQISSLESRLSRLQAEVDRMRAQPTAVSGNYRRSTPNGTKPRYASGPVYNGSSETVVTSSTRSDTPPAHGSVWNSMHAPRPSPSSYATPISALPKSRQSNRSFHHSPGPPSPTPSMVTLGDDGWWH